MLQAGAFQPEGGSSMYQVADFGRGPASDKDLEQLPVDWERGAIFHFKSIVLLEISGNVSFFPATHVIEKCTPAKLFAFPEPSSILPLRKYF